MRRCVALTSILVATMLGTTTADGARPAQMQLHLRGFGQSFGESMACPYGRTAISILKPSGKQAGAISECVLSVQRFSKSGIDPWRIVQSASQMIPLPGGTVRTRVRESYTFDRNGRSTTRWVGKITGGDGRYVGATGEITGTGTGHASKADWLLTLQFS